MRWADSDSDDSDDGYNVNEESSEASITEEAPISSDNQRNKSTSSQSHNTPPFVSQENYKNKYRNDNKGERKNHPKSYQKGGNGGNFVGGKNRPQNPQRGNNKNRGGPGSENWKQLAKASSRFSSGTLLNNYFLFGDCGFTV